MIDAAAARLAAARVSGTSLVSVDGTLPGGADGAYELQSAVARLVGAVGGFKCGRRATDAVPKRAPVFAADVHDDGAILVPGGADPAIEIEIGFRLLDDPPPLDLPDFEDRLRARVEVVPAFELIGSRLADPVGAGELWQLADNQNNDAVVIGTRDPDARDVPLERRDVRLEIGGREVHAGPAEVPGGDAFATFVALVRVLGTHCGGLRAGQVCITGALSGPHRVAFGERVRGRVEGLGEVGASIGR